MRGTRYVLAAVVVVLALAMAGGNGLIAQEQHESAEPCCFANPGFSGVCTVVPDDGETCADILKYLNTPDSTGKNYCGNTAIRGGWELVECPEPEQAGAH